LWLIGLILANHKTETAGKGMPLGNLTSQFFANIYLAELDNFVKHELKSKYYLRYVDDFVILHWSKKQLEEWKMRINNFLAGQLKLCLHPDKTKIIPLRQGVPLVGFRCFRHYRLLKKSNLRKMQQRMEKFRVGLAKGEVAREHILLSVAGWDGYAQMGNTYRLRQNVGNEVAEMLKPAQ
jgi:RNA-directed DNA polymerase